MNRQMPLDHLAATERHIAEGKQHVLRQEIRSVRTRNALLRRLMRLHSWFHDLWTSLRDFDEKFYTLYYADVCRAIAERKLRSGLWHYLLFGWREGRRITSNDAYKRLGFKKSGSTQPVGLSNLESLKDRLDPIEVEIVPLQQPMTNVFVPTLEPALIFGGYTAFFHFLCRLREAGAPIRFIVMDDVQSHLRWFLENIQDARWKDAFAACETVNLTPTWHKRPPLQISPSDAVVAYSCWMAHACMPLTQHSRAGKFLFFCQEYESAFHHYDSVRFIVDAAYDLPHVPLFNSRTLHDYFRTHKIGVFKRTAEDQLFFEHVISTSVCASVNSSSRSTSKRRLLFYARPEAHAGRNLFEIGILALRECAIRGVIGPDWELVGIGSAVAYEVEIVEGVIMSILPRVPQADYEQFLMHFDLGLSLMSAPHPGVVHFEWAAAGIPTIVNTTPERDREYFERFGRNLISAEPSVSGIADAIERAVKNLTRERSEPTINLSSFSGSWDEAFSKPLITEVIRRMSIPTKKRR